MLSKTHKHYGPPVWVSNSNTFLERWKNNEYGSPFIENGTWTVIAERMYFTAKEMLYDEAAMSGLGRDLDPNTMQVLSHVQTLAAADPLMMTELLDPKLPWEV